MSRLWHNEGSIDSKYTCYYFKIYTFAASIITRCSKRGCHKEGIECVAFVYLLYLLYCGFTSLSTSTWATIRRRGAKNCIHIKHGDQLEPLLRYRSKIVLIDRYVAILGTESKVAPFRFHVRDVVNYIHPAGKITWNNTITRILSRDIHYISR